MVEILNDFDTNVLVFIHRYTHNAIFDMIMPHITFLGNGGLVWIIISAILLTRKRYRNVGLMCLCALIVSTVLGQVILKHLIKRPRPFISMPDVGLLIPEPLGYSFPSGHSTSAFAVSGIMYEKMRKYGIYAVILAVLIAFSRIYLFVHYPSDVILGIVIGLICSKIVLGINKKLTSNRLEM
ncbi:MAG TPA: phosphatase PAP2 family protein [Clostridiaceae bacterium]|nr:phosphatase PAP2 family protein [Clostridiaceae bacterium]